MPPQRPPSFDAAELFRDVYWHQQWEVFQGVFTPGRNPVSFLADMLELPADLSGKRVLDVGAWNGCMSLECERRGAREVVALSPEDPATTGFERLKQLLGSQVRYERGSIYDLDPRRLGHFELVLCLGVIYHLRYPVLGVDNLRRVCRGELLLETHVLDGMVVDPADRDWSATLAKLNRRLPELPLLQFYRSDELYGDATNWFAPTVVAMREILESAGFAVQWTKTCENREYYRATVRPGMPDFLRANGSTPYELQQYTAILECLFGELDSWRADTE